MSSRTTFHTFPILAVTLYKYKKHTFLVFSRPTTRTHLPKILYPRKLSSHCGYIFFLSLIRDHRSWFTLFYRIQSRRLSISFDRSSNNWNATSFFLVMMQRIIVSREISMKIFKLTRFFIHLNDPRIFANNYIYMYIYGYSVRKKNICIYIYIYVCV